MYMLLHSSIHSFTLSRAFPNYSVLTEGRAVSNRRACSCLDEETGIVDGAYWIHAASREQVTRFVFKFFKLV